MWPSGPIVPTQRSNISICACAKELTKLVCDIRNLPLWEIFQSLSNKEGKMWFSWCRVLLWQHFTLTRHCYYTYSHSWILTSIAYGVSIFTRKIEVFMEICKKNKNRKRENSWLFKHIAYSCTGIYHVDSPPYFQFLNKVIRFSNAVT